MESLSKLSSREKAIVSIAGIVLLGMLFHALLIEPFNQKKLELNQAFEQGLIDLKWMRTAVTQIPLNKSPIKTVNFQGSLANLIDREVKSQGLNDFLTQMTPISDDEIRVRYKAINFNRLLKFIAIVNSHGLKVKDLRVDATDKLADVDCSLVLQKNG